MNRLEDAVSGGIKPERQENIEPSLTDRDEARNIRISDLDFSPRVRRCLRYFGMETLGDVVAQSPESLLARHNFGMTSLKELRRVLNEYGFDWGGNGKSVRYKIGTLAAQRAVQKVREALSEGAKTRNEIAERTGYSYYSVCKIVRGNRIEVEYSKGGRKRKMDPKKVNELIDTGKYNLREIGEKAGEVSYELVRQYLRKTGQHERWKEARNKRKSLIEEIAGEITRINHERVSWAEQKALDYVSKHRGADFDKLVNLFSFYERAVSNGEKVSLREFGEATRLHFADVGRILKHSGLRTLVKHYERSTREIIQERRRKIKTAAEKIGLSRDDIAYLFPKVGINNLRTTYAGGIDFGPPEIYKVKINGKIERVTYRLASEVYEAEDTGFEVREIAELVGRNIRVVRHVLEDRAWIAEDLNIALDIFYPERRSGKPYLNRDVGGDGREV